MKNVLVNKPQWQLTELFVILSSFGLIKYCDLSSSYDDSNNVIITVVTYFIVGPSVMVISPPGVLSTIPVFKSTTNQKGWQPLLSGQQYSVSALPNYVIVVWSVGLTGINCSAIWIKMKIQQKMHLNMLYAKCCSLCFDPSVFKKITNTAECH